MREKRTRPLDQVKEMKAISPHRFLLYTILPLFLLVLACGLSANDDPTETPPPTESQIVVVTSTSITVATSTSAQPAPVTETIQTESTSTSIAVPTNTLIAPTVQIETVPAVSLTSTPYSIDTLEPGQQDAAIIEERGYQSYGYHGRQFQPIMIFAEAEADLNIALKVYDGIIEEDINLDSLSPMSQADNSPIGRPELLVFTPNRDGDFSIVVVGREDTAGGYIVYMYDATTPADNTQLFSDLLGAGETKNYLAVSNGARPVIAFVDQLDQSDLQIQIVNHGGSVVAQANYGGSGSAEAAFILPLDTQSYTIRISEVGGGPATYNLALVTLN